MTGIKESDTGLAAPALWDLAADKQTLTNEQPLQVTNLEVVLKLGNKATFSTNLFAFRWPDAQKLSMPIQMTQNI